MSSSSSNGHEVWPSGGVQVAILGLGVAIGTGLAVCVLRWKLDKLKDYADFLSHELQRLKEDFQTHLQEHLQGHFPVLSQGHQRSQGHPVEGEGEGDASSSGAEFGSFLSSDEDDELLTAHDGAENLQPPVCTEDSAGEMAADTTPTPRLSSAKDSDLSKIFQQVDRLMDGSDSDRYIAYSILHTKSKDRQMMMNAEFLWRFAKATYFLSQLDYRGDKSKKSLVYKSKDLAGRALQLDTSNPEAHKWWAITLGSAGEYEGSKAQIHNGYQFKKHIEASIELNPNDDTARHLMGRWCYGVSMLSWTKRKAAEMLLTALPTATIDDALKHFLDAERLSPERWKENLLYIGKCYIEKKEYRKAVVWLEKAHRLPVKNSIDVSSQEEIESLLTQYRGYRV